MTLGRYTKSIWWYLNIICSFFFQVATGSCWQLLHSRTIYSCGSLEKSAVLKTELRNTFISSYANLSLFGCSQLSALTVAYCTLKGFSLTLWSQAVEAVRWRRWHVCFCKPAGCSASLPSAILILALAKYNMQDFSFSLSLPTNMEVNETQEEGNTDWILRTWSIPEEVRFRTEKQILLKGELKRQKHEAWGHVMEVTEKF